MIRVVLIKRAPYQPLLTLFKLKKHFLQTGCVFHWKSFVKSFILRSGNQINNTKKKTLEEFLVVLEFRRKDFEDCIEIYV